MSRGFSQVYGSVQQASYIQHEHALNGIEEENPFYQFKKFEQCIKNLVVQYMYIIHAKIVEKSG